MLYNIMRGFHLLAIIAWMAGLLYLPRLFVYHTRSSPGSEVDHTLQLMELNLLRIIMNPAMIAVFVFGGSLVWIDGYQSGWRFLGSIWFIIMILGGFALAGWHHYLAMARKALAKGHRVKTERFWRMTNEIPFIAAICVVMAATTKIGG